MEQAPTDDPRLGNRLLRSLPATDYGRLADQLTLVDLVKSDVIHSQSARVRYVYFPVNGIISRVGSADDHRTLELGTIGREGMSGLSLAFDNGEWPCESIVHIAGRAARLPATAFLQEIARADALATLMTRYAQGVLVECMQSMICLHFHAIEQRLCRRLLAAHAQCDEGPLPLTHQLLATMLGVRRASVTVAARALQRAGTIEYRRGHIAIRDHRALEARACRCHAIIRQHLDRVTASIGGPR